MPLLPCGGRRPRTGFTLVELLVVITIITVLAAILFPIFAAAREKSRQTVCLPNMRLLGLAFEQYSQDADDTLPCSVPMTEYGGTGCSGAGWAGNLYPYVKDAGVYHCPSDATRVQDTDSTFVVPPQFVPLSYLYNEDLTSDFFGYASVNGIRSKMTAPSSTVLLFEAGRMAFNPTAPDGIDGPLPDSTGIGYPGSGTSNGWFIPSLYVRGGGSPYCVAVHPIAFCQPPLFPTGSSFGQRYNGGTLGHQAFYMQYSVLPRHTQGINFLAADAHARWAVPDLVSAGNVPNGPDNAQNDFCTGHALGVYPNSCAAGTNNMTLPDGQKAILTMSPL